MPLEPDVLADDDDSCKKHPKEVLASRFQIHGLVVCVCLLKLSLEPDVLVDDCCCKMQPREVEALLLAPRL